MIFITGASDNHIKTLHQYIRYFLNVYINDLINNNLILIVYNLGLTAENWNNLQNTFNIPNIKYKTFDFSIYPEYVNIHVNAGEYAWKPIIIYDICNEYKNDVVFWMDSGNAIHYRLDDICNHAKNHGIYTANSPGLVSDWTYPKTIEYMGCQDMLHYQNKNATCIGVNTSILWVNDFVSEFKKLALTKECIAPEGSSRDNHRQDQAVFTLLYYIYQRKYHFLDSHPYYIGYTAHQDID